MVQKNLWSKKNFGQKKCWSKKILVRKKFWSKKSKVLPKFQNLVLFISEKKRKFHKNSTFLKNDNLYIFLERLYSGIEFCILEPFLGAKILHLRMIFEKKNRGLFLYPATKYFSQSRETLEDSCYLNCSGPGEEDRMRSHNI